MVREKKVETVAPIPAEEIDDLNILNRVNQGKLQENLDDTVRNGFFHRQGIDRDRRRPSLSGRIEKFFSRRARRRMRLKNPEKNANRASGWG